MISIENIDAIRGIWMVLVGFFVLYVILQVDKLMERFERVMKKLEKKK